MSIMYYNNHHHNYYINHMLMIFLSSAYLMLSACAPVTAYGQYLQQASNGTSSQHLNHQHHHITTNMIATSGGQQQPAISHSNQLTAISPHFSSSSASAGAAGKKSSIGGAQAWQMQNLNKFQKYLTEHQQELMRANPGSLWAVARAIKMTIKECQYQMRHEPWDCPIHGFSVRPVETFGLLMSRSIKETSFIQSLLSSAIAHSVARACTESIITTCSRKQLPHGNGFGENIEFGLEFARNFTEVTHELQQQQQKRQQQTAAEFTNQKSSSSGLSSSSSSSTSVASSLMMGYPNNNIATAAAINSNQIDLPSHVHQLRVTSGGGSLSSSGRAEAPIWKEKRLRQMINVHNDEVGHLIVLNYMRRECKCHGISGACTLQTCWDKLPPFRDVANRLHDSLDKALRVEMYVAPQGSGLTANRHKSLTSGLVKKSNKKRSSSLQAANLLSGLGRSSTPSVHQFTKTLSLMGAGGGGGDTSMDSGGGGGGIDTDSVGSNGGTSVRSAVGRLQAHQEMNSISNNIGSGGGSSIVGTGGTNVNEVGGIDKQSASSEFAQNTIQYASLLSSSSSSQQLSSSSSSSSNMTSVKKRPIARSIGLTASTITPGKLDLLYAEESPDFCVPSERYNIKGTKGRVCSESSSAPNSCETLCCGRGYKTEIREEKYTCECKFQYCCNLKCNTCTRRKVIHKCL